MIGPESTSPSSRASGARRAIWPGRDKDVVLPAAGRDDVALAHQEAIARIESTCTVVQSGPRHREPSVGDVEEQPPAPPSCLHGPNQGEVGIEVDLAIFAARGQPQINDVGVGGMLWSTASRTVPVRRSYGPAGPKGFPSDSQALSPISSDVTDISRLPLSRRTAPPLSDSGSRPRAGTGLQMSAHRSHSY